jgi:hypothetical protein
MKDILITVAILSVLSAWDLWCIRRDEKRFEGHES